MKRATTPQEGAQSQALGQLLRQARQRAGYTQDTLAVATQLGQSTINKLENGATSNPGFFTLAKLASVLRLSLDDLASELKDLPKD